MSGQFCPGCRERKPRKSFYTDRTVSSGLRRFCRDCYLLQSADYYRRNRVRVSERYRFGKYGITQGMYEQMLADQFLGCAICGKDSSENIRGNALAVDHDHTTGKIRGLLCTQCNQVLGVFQDDPDRFDRAAYYLRYHKQEPA